MVEDGIRKDSSSIAKSIIGGTKVRYGESKAINPKKS
jgi:hypothetical protein